MRIFTKGVVLENVEDVVNYVTKGLPATKKQFNSLKQEVGVYDANYDIDAKPEVTISGDLAEMDEASQDLLIKALEISRINEIKTLTIGGVIAMVLAGGAFAIGCAFGASRERDRIIDELHHMDDNDYINCSDL